MDLRARHWSPRTLLSCGLMGGTSSKVSSSRGSSSSSRGSSSSGGGSGGCIIVGGADCVLLTPWLQLNSNWDLIGH